MSDFPDRETLDLTLPPHLEDIEAATKTLNFDMASIPTTGALLRTLVSAKPAANVLELGTGTGMATCWLLDGLDQDGHLVTVDNDPVVQQVAKINLGHDPRINFIEQDGSAFLHNTQTLKFDLIFADALPGKFSELDEALSLLADGGVYVCDDLLPQDSWPDDHAPKVPVYIDDMRSRPDLEVEYWEWSSGILLARRTARG